MAGTVKKLQHPEGTNVGAPTDLGLATSTTVIAPYADDAAFVLANGVATQGDVYMNTTLKTLRMYVTGAWRNIWIETDTADPTKVIVKDLTGQTTGASLTLAGVATANRIVTFPDATTTLVGRATTDTGSNRLQNKELDDATVAFVDEGDTSKKLKFQASGITTATTRTLTAPDANTTILGHDATQIITNKDIDGGTAANTRRITIPKDTLANLNSLTRKEATIVYATDTEFVYVDDGSMLKTVGGGAGGAESVTTITNADYTVLDNDGYTTILFSTGNTNRTLTLPTVGDNENRLIKIMKVDSGTGYVTIDGEGSETINGALTNKVSMQYEALYVQADDTGSFWYITNRQFNRTPQNIAITTAGGGFGTATNTFYQITRLGKFAHLQGRLTTGTVTGAAAALFLPAGYTLDSNHLSTNASGIRLGTWEYITGTALFSGSNVWGPLFFDGSDTGTIYFSIQATGGAYKKELGNSSFGNATPLTFNCQIPIAEWEG